MPLPPCPSQTSFKVDGSHSHRGWRRVPHPTSEGQKKNDWRSYLKKKRCELNPLLQPLPSLVVSKPVCFSDMEFCSLPSPNPTISNEIKTWHFFIYFSFVAFVSTQRRYFLGLALKSGLIFWTKTSFLISFSFKTDWTKIPKLKIREENELPVQYGTELHRFAARVDNYGCCSSLT